MEFLPLDLKPGSDLDGSERNAPPSQPHYAEGEGEREREKVAVALSVYDLG